MKFADFVSNFEYFSNLHSNFEQQNIFAKSYFLKIIKMRFFLLSRDSLVRGKNSEPFIRVKDVRGIPKVQ